MRAVVYFIHVRPVFFQFLAHMNVKVVHVFGRVLPFSDPALIGNYDNQITRLVQSTNSVDNTGIENEVFNFIYVIMTFIRIKVPSRSRNIALFILDFIFPTCNLSTCNQKFTCGEFQCIILNINSFKSSPSEMLALPTPFDLRSYSRNQEIILHISWRYIVSLLPCNLSENRD